jgi:hypothetical protein
MRTVATEIALRQRSVLRLRISFPFQAKSTLTKRGTANVAFRPEISASLLKNGAENPTGDQTLGGFYHRDTALSIVAPGLLRPVCSETSHDDFWRGGGR